jgi:hypothetical protein
MTETPRNGMPLKNTHPPPGRTAGCQAKGSGNVPLSLKVTSPCAAEVSWGTPVTDPVNRQAVAFLAAAEPGWSMSACASWLSAGTVTTSVSVNEKGRGLV